MPTDPLVCSVVLTWNNFDDTDECLRSLAKQTHPNHRILVVDNGSTDGSAERLQKLWSGSASFILSDANLGCGGGYALGAAKAVAEGADYVAIIDNDIVADPRLVESLIAPFRAGGRVGLAAPIMTFYDRPDRVWFAGGSYNRLFGFTRHPYMGASVRALEPIIGTIYGTDYAPSCAVLLSRAAIEDVGLPDERFFFGHDDVDWCLRARAKGYLRVVVGQPLVKHKVSTTGGRRGSTVFTDFSAYHHAKGSMLLGAKHARGWRLGPYLFGQLCIRFPYYSLEMLRERRLTGPASYLRGLIQGAQYLKARGP